MGAEAVMGLQEHTINEDEYQKVYTPEDLKIRVVNGLAEVGIDFFASPDEQVQDLNRVTIDLIENLPGVAPEAKAVL